MPQIAWQMMTDGPALGQGDKSIGSSSLSRGMPRKPLDMEDATWAQFHLHFEAPGSWDDRVGQMQVEMGIPILIVVYNHSRNFPDSDLVTFPTLHLLYPIYCVNSTLPSDEPRCIPQKCSVTSILILNL